MLVAEANKQSVDGCHHFKMQVAEMLRGSPPVKRLQLQSKILSDIAQAMQPESHSNVAVQSLCQTGKSFGNFLVTKH